MLFSLYHPEEYAVFPHVIPRDVQVPSMSSRGACRFSLRHPEEAKPTKDLFSWVRRVWGRRSFAALRMTEERESGGQRKENQDDGERISGWRKKVRDGMERVQDNRGRVKDGRETEALALSV